MRLLVTRPEPDASELKDRLAAMGHCAMISPLFVIDLVAPPDLNLDGVQALIATSRNAIRSLACHAALASMRPITIYVVGPGTAAEARVAGFEDVREGPATARDLLPAISADLSPSDGALLHVAGDKLTFDLKAALERGGFAARKEVVYRTYAVGGFSPPVADAIRSGTLEGVILMSPRTAKEFARLAGGAGLAAAACKLVYFCLSEAVANALETLAPPDMRIAARPNLEEVLALLARGAPESG